MKLNNFYEKCAILKQLLLQICFTNLIEPPRFFQKNNVFIVFLVVLGEKIISHNLSALFTKAAL
jgi:hypothetical protein